MNLFYQPKIGDRVRIKKTKLTGIVIKGGTMCIVKLKNTPYDNWEEIPNFKTISQKEIKFIENHVIFHYRRLEPANTTFFARAISQKRKAIKKVIAEAIKTLNF